MATDTPVDIGSLIWSDPDIHGGRPLLAGTGLSVSTVALRYRAGETAEEMREDLGTDVPLSHFHAAIAYYLANREQVDADLADEAALHDRLAAEARAGGRPTGR